MADQSLSIMKWFARGGSHMNYYMWTGGNNYGRWTGDAITHMYAVDAIVCPDGLPHEPKFSHTTNLHTAVATVASQLVATDAQLGKAVSLGQSCNAYVYGTAAFIENLSGKDASKVQLKGHTFDVPSGSSSLVDLSDGKTLFNSKTVAAAANAAPTRQVGLSPHAQHVLQRTHNAYFQRTHTPQPATSSTTNSLTLRTLAFLLQNLALPILPCCRN
jgi:hypothetical protein